VKSWPDRGMEPEIVIARHSKARRLFLSGEWGCVSVPKLPGTEAAWRPGSREKRTMPCPQLGKKKHGPVSQKDIVMSARKKTNARVIMAAMLIVGVAICSTVASESPRRANEGMKRDRYLLLDSRVIESVENAELTVGTVQKDKNNPLFKEDKPWEPRFDNVYANVMYDAQDKLYKCWYSPFIIDERTTSTPPEKRNPESRDYMGVRPNRREMGVCYAVSKDGIHWEKPELGLVEFGGNKRNNILMRGQEMRGMFRGPHGAGVFKDLHESNVARRYKMFFRAERMAVAFSPDGVHWDNPILCREIEAPGDTHNNAFWAATLGKYVAITRLKTRGNIRLVARTESPDFVNWTKAKVVLRGVKPRLQTHDMVVFRTGGVYIGLLGLMDFPQDSNYHVRQHVELAWSPDTVTWRHIQGLRRRRLDYERGRPGPGTGTDT